MTVIVIDLFEIVAVDVRQAERDPLALMPRDIVGQGLLKTLAISHLGQSVDARV